MRFRNIVLTVVMAALCLCNAACRQAEETTTKPQAEVVQPETTTQVEVVQPETTTQVEVVQPETTPSAAPMPPLPPTYYPVPSGYDPTAAERKLARQREEAERFEQMQRESDAKIEANRATLRAFTPEPTRYGMPSDD